MLDKTKVKFELILDPDMYLLFEKGVRGRVSYIFKGYSKANNKYLKTYPPKHESKHIIYLDVNNLYGYVMSKFLPTSGFKWIDPKEFDWYKYISNRSKGCVGNVKKLIPNFFDEEKYVLHYENLQLYLRLSLKLKKIHRVLEFNQSNWLKPYVEFSTHKRIKAKKNGDKDGKALYKLMNNVAYGKTGKLKK